MRPRPQRLMDYREYPVLYVDDEPENLRIFELGFRRDFHVITARDGREAMEILNERPVALVLSDQRMPGMSGVDLLARVRDLDPKVVRILITAYGDAETLSRAVNDGSIYRYVPKPWEPDELNLTLRRGIEVYALDREREDLLRELSIINRVSESINQQLQLDPLLDLLLETLTEDLGYDGAALLFIEEQGRRLGSARTLPRDCPVATWLRQASFSQASAPSFLKHLCDGEVQLLSIDRAIEYEIPVREWITEVAAEEILVVPLTGKDGVIGAMAVDNRRGGKRFDVSDRTLLEGVATQAVVALTNARLVGELRRSQEQVLRADRLGTLGTLAAGLAHEINNPLVSIRTFLSLAPDKRHEDDAEFWNEYYEVATGEVERIRRLVASMESMSRAPAEEVPTELCDPSELAATIGRLLGGEAEAAGVRFEVDCDVEAPKIICVRDHLHQVLLNLVLNAIQASAAGDRVVLRVFAEEGDDGPGLAIEVSDVGCGIAPADLESIFDPFFTRKGPDQGTGLGLTICQQIVTAHGGSIDVRSDEGQGTTFRVHLPCDPESA